MRMTIEIPDTIRKDEAVLKKDLRKFIDESINYFQEVVNEKPRRYDASYYDRVTGSLSMLRLIRNWVEEYEIQM